MSLKQNERRKGLRVIPNQYGLTHITKIRCGGSYCKSCKKCITPPRLRKHYVEEWWTICEECEEDVLRVIFKPREDSLTTDFHIKYEDIPLLMEFLLSQKK